MINAVRDGTAPPRAIPSSVGAHNRIGLGEASRYQRGSLGGSDDRAGDRPMTTIRPFAASLSRKETGVTQVTASAAHRRRCLVQSKPIATDVNKRFLVLAANPQPN